MFVLNSLSHGIVEAAAKEQIGVCTPQPKTAAAPVADTHVMLAAAAAAGAAAGGGRMVVSLRLFLFVGSRE